MRSWRMRNFNKSFDIKSLQWSSSCAKTPPKNIVTTQDTEHSAFIIHPNLYRLSTQEVYAFVFPFHVRIVRRRSYSYRYRIVHIDPHVIASDIFELRVPKSVKLNSKNLRSICWRVESPKNLVACAWEKSIEGDTRKAMPWPPSIPFLGTIAHTKCVEKEAGPEELNWIGFL